MSLKKLIEGQKIRIDPHQRGAVTPKNLKGVHIHKQFTDKKRRNKAVRIDITGEKITFDKSFNEVDIASIVKEISHVIETDRQKLIELSDYISDALWRWSNKEVTVELARQYSRNLAKLFGLKEEIAEEVVRRVTGNLVRYIGIHLDEQHKLYIIDQDRKKIIISPGRITLAKSYEEKIAEN